jgi:hypothetical protein
MECYIIGGGPYKSNIEKNKFIIGINLHYTNANMFVSIDEAVLDKIFYELKPNLLVATSHKQYEKYKNFNNCLNIDYRNWYNVNSLSSGLLGIVLANKLNFSKIKLLGFTNLLDKSHHQYSKFLAIKENREYIICQ